MPLLPGHLCTSMFVLAFSMLLGCTSTQQLGTYEESLDPYYVPMEEELWAAEQADKFHAELIAEGQLLENEDVNQLVEQIEARLLEDYAGREDIRIYILRSPIPNAMAWPNGAIYLHSGLFTSLSSVDQIAAITAHEIAHVTERHSVEAVIERKNTMVTAHIADLATGGFGLAYFPALASMTSHSREQEAEADAVGIRRLEAAGYQPEAMVEVFEAFKTMPDLKHIEYSIYSSHPSQDARIANLQNLVEAAPVEAAPELADAQFNNVKAAVMRINLDIRLRWRQFRLAEVIVDQAADYFGEGTQLDFYRGEIYRGMASYPVDAAYEKYWIETGKEKRSNPHTAEFEAAVPGNLANAAVFYEAAASGEPARPLAYKRLGQISAQAGDHEQALVWYQRFLETKPKRSQQRHVERLMQRSQQ